MAQQSIGNCLVDFNNKLGSGSFGEVFKGIYFKDGLNVAKDVAVKQLDINQINLQQDQQKRNQQLKDILTECQILQSFSHYNMCLLYESYYDQEKNQFYFMLEYCSLGVMKDPLSQKYSFEQIKLFLVQLVDCLVYLESKSVCHRDLKPSNILLYSEKQLKLCDFGFAKIIQPQEKQHTRKGSPPYICPQIYQTTQYDPFKADTWALGVILYTMVYKYYPFELQINELVSECQRKIIEIDLKFDNQIQIPNQLQDLISKMLNKDENLRYNLKDVINHPFFIDAVNEIKNYDNTINFINFSQ